MLLFRYVEWKNFLSTGNAWTKILLDRSSTTLIVGKNGGGKSTLLDALTFVLFGKPFRKINKPQLINSINNKDCLVNIEFDAGNKRYKIIRGIKPNIFEIYCDGVLINQDSKLKDYQDHLEKNILKMNYKSFTQIVILGSASFTPFMQLTAADRRAIIEVLLDIEIFSSMNIVLKLKQQDIKETISQVRSEITLLNVHVASAEKLLKEIQNTQKIKIESNTIEIEKNQAAIAALHADIAAIQQSILETEESTPEISKYTSKSAKLSSYQTQIEMNIDDLRREIDFFKGNNICPKCHQEITDPVKHTHIDTNEKKVEELSTGLFDLADKMAVLNDKIAAIRGVLQEISVKQTDIVVKSTRITEINKYITRLQNENNQMATKSGLGVSEEQNIKKFRNQIDSYEQAQNKNIETQHYYEIASMLLKDSGIKTKIIKTYLPVMNKLVNKYLATMDFFVNFNLDENFNESIKSRFRDEFAYANFSEGEKQKIDLALLFTWRAIAKMKNSVSTNLLILDEVFDSSLDSNATDELLKILQALGPETNLFVISHREDILYDKFRSMIRFEKVNNFSRIAA